MDTVTRPMVLAEALTRRKDLRLKIDELSERIGANLMQPHEDQQALFDQMEQAQEELEQTIIAINHANARSGVMERSMRKNRYQALANVYRRAAQIAREAPIKPAIPISVLIKRADEYNALARTEELQIQMTDWNERI